MIPVLFGPENRRKYGVFQPALGRGSKGRGIVICDALFDEALCAHRAISFASGSLAQARWNSLRFDYFGTGDSAGDTVDFSLARALDDTTDAIDELKASTGLEAVYLLGMRLGGALAMQIAATREDVRGLVLWDPVIEGETVLRRYGVSGTRGTDGDSVEGYRLPGHLQDELRTLSIAGLFGDYDRPLLMVCTSPTDQHRQIARAHAHVDFREVVAPEAWSNTAVGGVRPIPTAVVNEIREWAGT